MNHGFFTHSPFLRAVTGYLADYTSNKRYVTSQETADFNPNHVFKEFGIHSQMATASLIVVERLELFGMAGGTKERAKWHAQPPETDPSAIFFDFKSSYHFSWSAGARVILLQWGKTFLGADYTYFAIPSSPKSFFKFFNRLNLPLDLDQETFALKEWQTSVGLASRFAFVTPYGGMTYLQSRLSIESGPDTPRITYHNQRTLGYFYGLTLSITGKFHVQFERRVRNEFAYTFSTAAVF